MEMVEKKRARNKLYMQQIGLVSAVEELAASAAASSAERKRSRSAAKKLRAEQNKNAERRKSPRLVSPDGKSPSPSPSVSSVFVPEPAPAQPRFRRNRLNDGEDIGIFAGVEPKKDGDEEEVDDAVLESVERDKDGIRNIQASMQSSGQASTKSPKRGGSSKSKSKSNSMVNIANCRPVMLDDNVEKLTNQRILSITPHPTLPIVAVGDKVGSVGIWDASRPGEQSAFFELANRPIHSLSFNKGGDKLFTSSTDGTVRIWDAHTSTFSLLFQTFDSSPEYAASPGFGVEEDDRFFSTFTVLKNDVELLMGSSLGSMAHYDTRAKRVTFDLALSAKKLNTISVHPDGNSIAVCGNERQVKLFDLRKLGKVKNLKSKNKIQQPFAFYESKNSINSSFFSPDGAALLTTAYDDTINILRNPCERSGEMKKDISIAHNNQTGKWLSTLHAVWHPTDSRYFSCGAMKQPRCVEVFSASNMKVVARASGDYLSAVCSRVAFHPTLPIIFGANSSGRVTKIDYV